jgi:GLPGLI family protein
MTINGEKRRIAVPNEKLVFNDSLSLSYLFFGNNDPLDKNKKYCDKVIHHSMFYSVNNNHLYYGYNYRTRGKGYLLKDTFIKATWVFWEDSKLILGYQCKPALIVNGEDSTLVWFTPEIPKPFGPSVFIDLPGVVLEVFQQKNNLHMFATRIEKDTFALAFPKEGIIIPREKFFLKH